MIKLKKGLFEGEGKLTQSFGENPQAYAKFGLKGHNGIDYGIPTGRNLYSCIEGRVIEARLDATGYGNYVKIERGDCGVIYGHMKSFAVKVGELVKAGQVIGLSDNTGNSTGPHLHFGVFPIPRDRGNGYAGYINPFDKKLVEWVDNYYEEENPTEGQIEALQKKVEALEKELQEIRDSRNKWKKEYEDERDKNTKEVKDMQEHIESLQKTISEHGQQTSGYMVTISNLEESNKILAEEVLGCQRRLEVSDTALTTAINENERLTTKLQECKDGVEKSLIEKLIEFLKGGASK